MSADPFRKHFGSAPEHFAYAPGRLEFIGNHTDYNGGMVLGAAIDRGITVAIGRSDDDLVHLYSESQADEVACPLNAIKPQEGAKAWANYALGVLNAFGEKGLKPDSGLCLTVASDLPLGAGLSSSAAFELATAYALTALFGWEADRADLARLCRRAENTFVGMPCGILDQGVSAFGETDHLVRIDCREETFSTVPMPAGVEFVVINTEKKHSLVDSLYATRHRECFDAYEHLKQAIDNAPDCLAHIHPDDLAAHQEDMGEMEFARARHVTSEHQRVIAAEKALRAGDMAAVGKLLLASHKSSRVDFENSTPELDFLVDHLAEAPGVYGARLTGGGFGGAVMAVTDGSFTEEGAAKILQAYEARFDIHPSLFRTCTGPGARVLG